MDISKNWKKYVNNSIKGGFDPRKHPVFIAQAIQNAKKNYVETNGSLHLCATEMYKLGENIYPLIEKTITEGLTKINKEN